MKLLTLCEKIKLPAEVTQIVMKLHAQLEWEQIYPQLEKLISRNTWDEGLDMLRELLGDDEQGYRMLTCMLQAAVATSIRYEQTGIREEIFIDTMAAFCRFVVEHKESYGRYGFDRAFWTPRQLAMEEFRIGELEYEKLTFEGKKAISIHIPSDAKLNKETCDKTFREAKQFFLEHDSEYADCIYFCDSWLLAPNLKYVLPTRSNILLFQRYFHIIAINTDSDAYMGWVFKDSSLELCDVPQDTSLQRNMKKYLLLGGRPGSAMGILIK